MCLGFPDSGTVSHLGIYELQKLRAGKARRVPLQRVVHGS